MKNCYASTGIATTAAAVSTCRSSIAGNRHITGCGQAGRLEWLTRNPGACVSRGRTVTSVAVEAPNALFSTTLPRRRSAPVPTFDRICFSAVTHTAEQVDLVPQCIDTLEIVRAAEVLHSASCWQLATGSWVKPFAKFQCSTGAVWLLRLQLGCPVSMTQRLLERSEPVESSRLEGSSCAGNA